MMDWTPDELQTKLEQGENVFLKLWKRGCGACKLSRSALERIEADAKHPLVFGQINTDDYPEMLETAETEVLPVFFIFKDKKLLGQQEGFKGKERLEEFIRGLME